MNPSTILGLAGGARVRARAAMHERRIARAAKGNARFVVGPWLSEIGFEVLYWIPRLRALFDAHGISPGRVTAISRGGVAGWYRDVATEYVDELDLLDPDEYRRRREARVHADRHQKQMAVSELDRHLLSLAGLESHVLVHPLVMYNQLHGFWAGYRGPDVPQRLLRFGPLPDPGPASDVLDDAPRAPYVAVKPYFSACLPDGDSNRALWTELIHELAEERDVALLTTGLELDEHLEYDLADHPRIWALAGRVPAARNLDVQTRLIAGADALVATYGGFSYLGPFLGVPSYGLYSERNFNPRHQDVVEGALGSASAGASFSLLDIGEGGVAGAVLTPDLITRSSDRP